VGSGSPGSSSPFSVARVHFEQNATDQDVEVVFEVKGGNEGLANLTIVSPDGRTIVDFGSPNTSSLGMRQFRFESPEPKDVKALKMAYPEGTYVFTGTTASGKKLHGESSLSHILPTTTSLIRPGVSIKQVGTKDLEIAWKRVSGVVAYVVYIEQDDLGVNINATLPGSATTFAVPEGFLLPGTKYTLGIGTVSAGGNTSFLETSFTTAGQK
jgi:hypothetical protein